MLWFVCHLSTHVGAEAQSVFTQNMTVDLMALHVLMSSATHPASLAEC